MTHDEEAPLEYPPGPWVNVAVICERPLVDTDGLLSLIRIIDRIRVTTDAPHFFAEPAPCKVPAQAIGLLSGASEYNDGAFSLRVARPSGQSLPGRRVPVRFRNPLSTKRITVNLELGLTAPGCTGLTSWAMSEC